MKTKNLRIVARNYLGHVSQEMVLKTLYDRKIADWNIPKEESEDYYQIFIKQEEDRTIKNYYMRKGISNATLSLATFIATVYSGNLLLVPGSLFSLALGLKGALSLEEAQKIELQYGGKPQNFLERRNYDQAERSYRLARKIVKKERRKMGCLK